jgi:hypothetical protein
VLLSGRRWQTVLTLLGSFVYSTLVNDWRPSWKQHRAPWWQAVLVITVPTLIARSISRLGIGWLFSWPLVLVAYAAQGVLKVVGLPVQFVGHIVTAMFEVSAGSVAPGCVCVGGGWQCMWWGPCSWSTVWCSLV